MALGLDLLLGLANDRSGLMRDLAADLVEQLGMRVIARELRDTLKLTCLASEEFLKLTGALVDLALLAGKLMLALVEGVVAPIKGLLTLHYAVFQNANLLFALGVLCLGGLLALEDLLLGFEQGLFLEGLGGALGIGDDLLGLAVRALDL